jgi:hypothetical protein
MQLPREEQGRDKLISAIRHLKGNDYFNCVLAWFNSELQQRDVENRVRGMENTTTEAQALGEFLRLVSACQMPEQTETDDGSGIESKPAAILM